MTITLPQFVFINGPSGSGKSTLAKLLCDTYPSCWRESFAEPIREMLRTVFFPEDSPIEGPDRVDFRDGAVKKQNLLALARLRLPEATTGPTVRQAMIDFSEHYLKPRFGEEIFGQLCYARCMEQQAWYHHFIIDDSGFTPEAQYVISQIGAAECCLIRLHRSGCTFAGDSRGYIELAGVRTIDLDNDGAAPEMLGQLELEWGKL